MKKSITICFIFVLICGTLMVALGDVKKNDKISNQSSEFSRFILVEGEYVAVMGLPDFVPWRFVICRLSPLPEIL